MPKDESKRKNKPLFSAKLAFIFVAGLILGALIQFTLIQPLMDNSDSFKSKYASCELSREICDKEVNTFFSCMESNDLNPNDCT